MASCHDGVFCTACRCICTTVQSLRSLVCAVVQSAGWQLQPLLHLVGGFSIRCMVQCVGQGCRAAGGATACCMARRVTFAARSAM
jgi:hypothetical protein